VKTQRRVRSVVASRRVRSGVWSSWCHAGGKSETPRLFSWDFLRSVWSLLCNVTWRKAGRGGERRFAWGHEAIGCTAPRSIEVYGRMN